MEAERGKAVKGEFLRACQRKEEMGEQKGVGLKTEFHKDLCLVQQKYKNIQRCVRVDKTNKAVLIYSKVIRERRG